LTHTEVAVLEVLGDWNRVVEIPDSEALRRLANLVCEGDVRADRLVKAAVTAPAAIRERLRGVLAMAGSPQLAAQVPPARSSGVFGAGSAAVS
jgi:DNA-binding PucR family transcriptional regulator